MLRRFQMSGEDMAMEQLRTGSCSAGSRQIRPLADRQRPLAHNLAAAERSVEKASLNQVDNPAEVRLALVPPLPSVDEEVVLDIEVNGPKLVELIAIQPRDVDAICDSAAEGGGSVVLLDLPSGNRLVGARKGAVHPACKRSQGSTIA
jgi:hypothetical protein